MKKAETVTNDVIAKTAKLLAGAKTVYLATNGSHGHPDLRAMMPIVVEGARTVWFATSPGTNKVLELRNDNHAVIYVEGPRMSGECRLWGYVEILDDMESKKKVWNNEIAKHFPGGIESMTVLRFDAYSGVYADKNWETFPFEIE